MRTITVKGTGSVSAKPDYIELHFKLEAEDRDYEQAMRLASDELNRLSQALEAADFEKDSLKTTGFNIRTDYRSVRDKNDNYRRVFDGYVCVHELKLAFDFDSTMLARTLSVIASTTTEPELSVMFTVKDRNAISAELLKNAAENAKDKAAILCAATGTKLGALQTIDYNWGELNVYSNTRYDVEEDCMAVGAAPGSFSAEINPDDIKVSDTATFVWEIE